MHKVNISAISKDGECTVTIGEETIKAKGNGIKIHGDEVYIGGKLVKVIGGKTKSPIKNLDDHPIDFKNVCLSVLFFIIASVWLLSIIYLIIK